MATNRIRLDSTRHASFLAEGRKDPITKEPLRPGMDIVICANDKIAFIAENWNGECPFCHGSYTLSRVPASTELQFQRTSRNLNNTTTQQQNQRSRSGGFWFVFLRLGGIAVCTIAMCAILPRLGTMLADMFLPNPLPSPIVQPIASAVQPSPILYPTPTIVIPSSPPFTISVYNNESDAECVICLIDGWEGLSSPGTQQWMVDFPVDTPALLSLGWCAIDREHLDQNWPYMSYELFIDGYSIDLDGSLEQYAERDDGSICNFYSLLLKGWDAGTHSYIWVHHINQTINDGWGTFISGDYIMDFEVHVNP